MTFFFTLIFMQLVFWRPQEWLVPWLFGLPMLDAVFYLAILSMMIEVREGRMRFSLRDPQVFLLAGLWVAAMMSHIAHTYFAGLMDTILPVFKICIFTLLFFTTLDRNRRLRVVSLVFVAMSCVMVWHGMLQQWRGYGFAGQWPVWVPSILGNPPYWRSKFFGIFDDPNDTAQMIVASMPFVFAFPRRHNPITVLLGAGVVYFMYLGVMNTHSRGGVVAMAGTAAVGICLLFPPRWMPYLLGLGMAGALGLMPFSGKVLDQSAHDRVVFWGMANQEFKSNPLFGLGYEMFWSVTRTSRAAHNAFVLCYTELGVFGYWFWFGLLMLAAMGAWRTRIALQDVDDPDAQWLRRFAGLAIASIVGFSGGAYFLSRAFVYPYFFLFAVVGAIPYIAADYLPEDYPPLIQVRRDVFGYVTLGAIGSIIYVYVSIILLNKAFY